MAHPPIMADTDRRAPHTVWDRHLVRCRGLYLASYVLNVAYYGVVALGFEEQPASDTCGRCGSMWHVMLTLCPGCGTLSLCASCITAHVAELAEQAGRSLGE